MTVLSRVPSCSQADLFQEIVGSFRAAKHPLRWSIQRRRKVVGPLSPTFSTLSGPVMSPAGVSCCLDISPRS
jgi:hypothetical protein